MRASEALAFGAMGGAIGAAVMTAWRHLARRGGVIDKQVPQVIEEWLTRRAGGGRAGERAGPSREALAQTIHVGYGAAWGALFGLARRRLGPRRSTWSSGALFGVSQWAIAFLGFVPALRISRSALRSSTGENAVNVAAHLLYGLTAALVADELMLQQPRALPAGLAGRASAPVG